MKLCPICNISISKTGVIPHIRNCHQDLKDFEKNLLNLEIKSGLSYKEMMNLTEDYSNNLSLPDLQKKYKTHFKLSISIINNFGGKIRTLKQTACSQKTKEQYKATCIKKYNTDNVSKCKKIKDKKAATFLKHYGVDNIFKTQEFIGSLNDKMLKTYGVKRVTEPMLSATTWNSKLELRVKKILIALEIKHKHSLFVSGRQFDFFLPISKTILEIHGDFWHANPSKYKNSDLMPYPKQSLLAREVWARDLEKKRIVEELGYKYVCIWENDLKTHLKDDDKLSTYLKELNNANQINQ